MAKVVKGSKGVGGKKRGLKYKMPDRIPEGEILQDLMKNQWVVEKSIGVGGFGEIYSASKIGSKGDYAVKIEPKENGPLFVEMHFFMKNCREADINEWMKKKKLKFLGIPRYISHGTHVCKDKPYRFVIMERFGKSLDAVLNDHQNIIPLASIFRIALYVLDTLEYMHENGYVHADVKAGNLLFGFNKATEEKVYLVDFGLVSRYSSEFKPDPRCAHNGTIEFTSRDAHLGASTRRGDIEILGYNMLRWATSRLPWEDKLSDCKYVQSEKNKYMADVEKLLCVCFGEEPVPAALTKFFNYVVNLGPTEAPDYELCRTIFKQGLKASGGSMDGKFVFKTSKQLVEEPAVKKAKAPVKKSNVKERAPIPKKTGGKVATKSKAELKEVEEEAVKSERQLPQRAARGKVKNGYVNGFATDSGSEEDIFADVSPPKAKKAVKRSSGDKQMLVVKKKKTGV